MASDHNPLMWCGVLGEKQLNWRLNDGLLTQQDNVQFLKKEINAYFETNINKEVEIQNV